MMNEQGDAFPLKSISILITIQFRHTCHFIRYPNQQSISTLSYLPSLFVVSARRSNMKSCNSIAFSTLQSFTLIVARIHLFQFSILINGRSSWSLPLNLGWLTWSLAICAVRISPLCSVLTLPPSPSSVWKSPWFPRSPFDGPVMQVLTQHLLYTFPSPQNVQSEYTCHHLNDLIVAALAFSSKISHAPSIFSCVTVLIAVDHMMKNDRFAGIFILWVCFQCRSFLLDDDFCT